MQCHDTCCSSEYEEEVVLTTERRARKPHNCDDCPTPIKPGQWYRRHFFPDSRTTYTVHRLGGCHWTYDNTEEEEAQ